MMDISAIGPKELNFVGSIVAIFVTVSLSLWEFIWGA